MRVNQKYKNVSPKNDSFSCERTLMSLIKNLCLHIPAVVRGNIREKKRTVLRGKSERKGEE